MSESDLFGLERQNLANKASARKEQPSDVTEENGSGEGSPGGLAGKEPAA